jgi:hypothetical protein
MGDDERIRLFAVLEIPALVSGLTAVRVSIAADGNKGKNEHF